MGPRARAAIARHRVFVLLCLAGVTLRVLTQVAYRPAILYYDSYRYLANALELNPVGAGPIGYPLFVRPLLSLHNLAVLPAANHALGLGMGVLTYAVLLRRSVRRGLAAAAAAPILLDGYQLQIEQMVMSDTLFQALLLAAFAGLLWRQRPGLAAAAAVGLLLAAAVSTRIVGVPLIAPAVLYLLLSTPAWPRRVAAVATCATMFALPLLGYGAWVEHAAGGVAARYGSSNIFYARVAPLAECAQLNLPRYQEPLCPNPPPSQRPNEDYYYWHGPVHRYNPPPGLTTQQVVNDFVLRVATHQPLACLQAIGTDFIKYFAWDKRTFGNDLPASRWQFQLHYPHYRNIVAAQTATDMYGGHPPAVNASLVSLLRSYQLSLGHTPGPLLLTAAAAAILAACGFGHAPRSGLRLACLAMTLAGLGVLLVTTFYEFSWRYQLPTLALLPPAGALGLTALDPPTRTTGSRCSSPDG